MRNRRLLALTVSLCMMAECLSGCASRYEVTEDMIPTVIDLRQNAAAAQENEETAEVLGLAMNTSYLSEMTRLDGDNSEAATVAAKDVHVVLKATSVEKDLKIKFVNEKNGRVITGTAFKVDVTDADKKSKEYTDDDKDGIIHIKDIAGGSYRVEMKDTAGYQGGQAISATVKDKIEYKTVDVSDEVKKEGEINVAGEDGAYGGKNTDASTSDPGAALTDTVKYVESRREPIYGERKQKTDGYGNPVYSRILKEPTHDDTNGDGLCDRCGGEMTHECQFQETGRTPATCGQPEIITETCTICSKTRTREGEPATGQHVNVEGDDNLCDVCGAQMPAQEASPQTTEGTPSASVKRNAFRMVAVPIEQLTSSQIEYDTTSEPVYEEEAEIIGYKYYGWQSLDDGTYYFDENGNAVTGTQVIQGVQYTFDSNGRRSNAGGSVGIDVSKYQRSIDWKKVKQAGIEFVYIRCGYRGYGSGVLVEDPMFRSHISGAKAAGLKVGIYFFSQAVSEAEAVEEASMAVSLARSAGGINLPIAIDSEYAAGGAGRADGLSKSARTTITRAFCNTVANSGYTPMVYASKSWFGEHLNAGSLGGYRIWVAHYASKCGYSGKYHVWQYTSKGSVPGVSGNVDMNISYM